MFFGVYTAHLISVLFCFLWCSYRGVSHVLELDKLVWKYGSSVLAVDVRRNERARNEDTYMHFTAMLLNP